MADPSKHSTSPSIRREPVEYGQDGSDNKPSHTPQLSTEDIIVDGLKIRLREQGKPFLCLPYALPSLVGKHCVSVDWKLLVSEDVPAYDHICCHQLREGDVLSTLLTKFVGQHTKALILLSARDNYSIAPEVMKGMTRSNLPIVVLTQSNGSKLLSILERYRDNVLARLDVTQTDPESSVDADQPANQSPILSKNRGDKESSGTGVGQTIMTFFGIDSKNYLWTELKDLMFSPDEKPVIISDNPEKLIKLMATMTNYEQQAKAKSNHSDVNDLLKKIQPHFEAVKDVPLYIIISYRLHLRSALYQCEELKLFIPCCLNLVEKLKSEYLAQAINDFLERLQISETHNQLMELLSKLEKGGSKQEFMITVNCSCIINLMYEVIKLADVR